MSQGTMESSTNGNNGPSAAGTAPPLIDPSLLEGLSEGQKQEALAAAAAAKRAEERAEQRSIDRALEQKRQERLRERMGKEGARQQQQQQQQEKYAVNSLVGKFGQRNGANNGSGGGGGGGIQFVSKRRRMELQQSDGKEDDKQSKNESEVPTVPNSGKQHSKPPSSAAAPVVAKAISSASSAWTEHERKAIRKTYLGTSADSELQHQQQLEKMEKKKKKTKLGKKAIFRFEWDDTDDTLVDDFLYANPVPIGGSKTHSAAAESDRRAQADNRGGGGGSSSSGRKNGRGKRPSAASAAFASDINSKPLAEMTPRDWRIMRENYQINVKGGRAPPPLRSFQDGNLLHPSLMKALTQVMRYQEPSPIQRQAIPIGLQRRDLIGIAETGSGKTAAFGLPLLQYILHLPAQFTSQQRVADHGPLALVVAPTRELALQIHGEFEKLVTFCPNITCCAIVGGQNLQQQSVKLRQGVHVVVGTPGRLNECLEMAYMVLNQCLYLVMDEGDRMIDMGFAPQLESILDAMGGTLKSENEDEAYQQEEEDRRNLSTSVGLPKHRLTAMFSATMPVEVEQMAKKYLRHPAVVSVGDKDSGKNARIVQRVIFLSSPSQKEKALRDLVLDRRFMEEKVIVFVNEKKHADGVGRMIEKFGRRCVVLHGGKSQDQREENLATFRKGGIVLVATDVAGRGLDIPDVAHVINYDLPTRSIDSYSHRIGRTGRAGKEGVATSLMSDEDEGIMAALKSYLESTGSPIPDRLARHPAANKSVEKNLIF